MCHYLPKRERERLREQAAEPEETTFEDHVTEPEEDRELVPTPSD